jgi:hypothetical protein
MMEQAPRGRYEHGAQRRRIGRKVTMAGIRSTALRLMKASRCKSSNGRRGRAIYAPLAMSADSEGLDQFEEGNAIGGHASEVEAVPRPAASPSSPPMTSRRFPASWRADPMPGGYARPGRQWPGPCLPLLPRKRGRSPAGEAADERRGASDRRQHRAAARAAGEGRVGLNRSFICPTVGPPRRPSVSLSMRGPSAITAEL